MASIIRRSFVSPAADASSDVFEPRAYNLTSQMLHQVTWWQLAVTFLLGLVVYDQCMQMPRAVSSIATDEGGQ